MTYRDRREARAARLRSWAESREARAAALHDRADELASVIPFGQPILAGHHSQGRDTRYRARIGATMDRAVENDRKAREMAAKAANIEAATAAAIYDDDADAVPALRAKLERLEAERARWKAYNAACRKAGERTPAALELLDAGQLRTLGSMANAGQLRANGSAPSYASSNLTGRIGQLRKRLERLEVTA